ncbi:glycosyltransferase family 1 protein [Oscillatoria sp. FACHB-1406]|uniref:glycosyltransferase family 1 protein n=1 Tax=Oscillatoria sp. FACHB-1406 TaxID=2692846 RepID=UPI00168403E5|nr:glycosyltransferase family 1 protein [Oscillatoria sp. FACHB-1406]MBD2579446.1 glycosyltransferase family 1 protein [Oscillatoria sp. FACHB-1406]
MQTLTQIVPILPPAVDGLGDYALNLARQLHRDWAIATQFIVANPTWAGRSEIEGFSAVCLRERSDRALQQILPKEGSILLHYSGYGYAQRGCPRWLATGLEEWKRGCTSEGKRALSVMFHEVYPYRRTPPWTSSFWLSGLQKQVAARLLKCSDRAFTNRENYARLLRQLAAGEREIPVLPVPSNIGEPAVLIPWERRERSAVVFGHRNTRSRLYQNYLPQVLETCRTFNLDTLYDIGVPTEALPPSSGELKILAMGVLSAPEASALLGNATIGFLSAPPPEYFGKSTVFAAYSAHGLLSVLPHSHPVAVEGLVAGQHYWAFDGTMAQITAETGRAIAQTAYTWYQTHPLSAQAQFFARSLLLDELGE